MISKGTETKIDRDEVRRQLDEMLARVKDGAIFPSQARIVIGDVSMSIKEARKFLNLAPGPILFAVRKIGAPLGEK